MSDPATKLRNRLKALQAAIEGERRNMDGAHVTKTDKIFAECIALAEAHPVSDRKPVDHVDVETIALDLTEGIWLRVKGISQHELLSLVKQSIHAGMKLRPKPEPTKE